MTCLGVSLSVRGGRSLLGDEVTSQTQAMQSIADKMPVFIEGAGETFGKKTKK